MSSFNSTIGMYAQTHFTVVEIDLPSVEGVCTISGNPGFGTPLTCDQPSNSTKTYKFRDIDSPVNFPESGVFMMVDSISEVPSKIKPEKGLASRGTATVTLIDSYGKDPNPFAPGVTQEVKESGGYLAKLNVRNELTNKACRVKNYRIQPDGTIDLANGAETKHYIIDSFDYTGNQKWSLKLKDELSRVDIGEAVWPIPLEGSIRIDVNDTTTSIPVDANVTYLSTDVIRSGDEFMQVTGVSGIGTSSATLTVATRGSDITGAGGLITKTNTEDHSAGDEVFVCEKSDDERIDDLLERILLDIGIDASVIPKSDWTAEVDEWLPLARVNTLWYESEDVNDVINMILSSYMIDMWFDPVAREIKISAVNVWKESSVGVSEGIEINQYSLKKRKEETLRATRSLVVYDKRFLSDSDDVASYKKASLFIRNELESDDLFGEPKTKRFGFNRLLDKDSADLLVNRYVNRFIKPESYSWVTPERKLNFKTGDVVDISFDDNISFDGTPSANSRAQITSVKTKYGKTGREYVTTALSYEPVFSDGSEVIVSGNVSDVNLYIQYAGAPSQPVTLTFIFDGAKSGSSVNSIPSIKAGSFPAGSKIIIILANGADLQARGGSGGIGATVINAEGDPVEFGTTGDGESGGIVYDAEGVDTDIYFSGATPSASYPTADGYIRAPSGGDGGFNAKQISGVYYSGDGGDGGDGRTPGNGGSAGASVGDALDGNNGSSGTDDGFTGSFGQDGQANDANGGSKGSGVVDSGATVVLFGDNATRYINGNGDH